MIRKLWPGILALALAAAFGGLNLSRLPLRVAIHWGLHGQANGWSSRLVLVLLLPGIGALLALVFAVAPRLDPKYRNFDFHASSYWLVANAVLMLEAAIHVMIIGYNLGWQMNISRLTGLGVGVLLVVLGNVMTRLRPNWIFGIRTPWTLSSEQSWRETHRLGGYLFVLAGVASIVTAILSPVAVVTVLTAGVGLAAVISIVWSYVVWKRDPTAHGSTA